MFEKYQLLHQKNEKEFFFHFQKKIFFPGMSGIRRNLDLCRSQKYQVCPVSVIIAQENAAHRWAVGEEMRQRATAKDGFHRLLYKTYQSIITTHTFPETTTISYQTWIVCIMRPSRFDHVKECSSIENIPHAAEKKKRMWKIKLRPIDSLYSEGLQ